MVEAAQFNSFIRGCNDKLNSNEQQFKKFKPEEDLPTQISKGGSTENKETSADANSGGGTGFNAEG